MIASLRISALCLLALTIIASAAPSTDPPELEKLRASYKAAVAKGTKSIVQSYIANLEKLRDIYARGSNLTGANKVQADIDRANVAMTTGEFLAPAAESNNATAPELDKLRAAHEADVERAIKPFSETYLRELDKLRDSYTRAANLAAANAVQTEVDVVKSGGASSNAPERKAADKQSRPSGKPPKTDWYVGKTWGAPPGASFTFAKGGNGEVKYPNGKTAPLKWEVLPSGVLKLTHEASTRSDVVGEFIYLINATEGKVGFRENSLDKPIAVLPK